MMLSVSLCRKWVKCWVLLTGLIPGITANSKCEWGWLFISAIAVQRANYRLGLLDPQYSNISSPSTTLTSTSTSTSRSTITSCATLGRLDYFPASLRSLPASVLASLTLSEAARLEEIIRSFVRVFGNASAIDPRIVSLLSSTFTSVQHDIASRLGSSGYAYLNLPGITDPCLLSTCVDQFLSQGSSATAANPSGLWIYQASSPCCGQCSITANAVEVSYWPTPAQTPLVTALVNPANNFT
jgi:hypothetical protein